MADEALKKIVFKKHPNEFVCHVAFVYKIALELHKKYGGSRRVIAAAALLHDYGRGQDEPHEALGAKLARPILKKLNYRSAEIDQVVEIILNHSSKAKPSSSLEEKIVSSADGAAQVIYSPLFGLLSRKEPREKPAWVIKYLEKGYAKISLPEFKKEVSLDFKKYKLRNQEAIKFFKSIS